MVLNTAIEQFLGKCKESLEQESLIKLTLSKSLREEQLENVYVRPILIKGKTHFSFTLHYPTRDETKNYDSTDALAMISLWVGHTFFNASLFTAQADYHLLFNKKRRARLLEKAPTLAEQQLVQSHDRQKNRLIEASNNPYLKALGITNAKGDVLANGQRKFRQINKYIEIIDSLLRDWSGEEMRIVDMGSGKGYLTFALYDYLTRVRKGKARITGIELRPQLVEFCNQLASQANYSDLDFVAQDINDYETGKLDMLIALHACDIATDIAIAKGIQSQASTIIVAPCCHKQIRQQMNCTTELSSILRHGILEERQAELITDGIRALLLEQHGYKTKVFEFISTEHTAKNLMIIATRSQVKPEAKEKIQAIKTQFGIQEHYLEKLLE